TGSSKEKKVRVWSVRGRTLAQDGAELSDFVAAGATFSPDGGRVALATPLGERDAEPTARLIGAPPRVEVTAVRLWDPPGEPRALEGWDGRVAGVAFAPDGKTVAAGGSGRQGDHVFGVAETFDARTGRAVGTPAYAPRPVTSLAYAPDGKTLAGGDSGGAVKL